MPREALKTTAQRMSVKPVSKLALQWQAVDGMTALIRRHLRSLYLSLDLTSVVQDNPWAVALSWLRTVFSKKQTLSQRPLAECPPETLPKRLRPYLLESGELTSSPALTLHGPGGDFPLPGQHPQTGLNATFLHRQAYDSIKIHSSSGHRDHSS